MESLDALNILKDNYHTPRDTELFKIIKRDLEVLEIFKKYYKSDGWSNGAVIQFWGMSDTQLNKIKEWLDK